MAIKLFDALGVIGLDTKGLKKGLASAKDDARKALKDIGKTTRKLGLAMTAAGGAITGAFGFAVKSAADFEQAITNAAVVTGKTGQALQDAKGDLEELALTLGRTTVFTASQAADALGILARKGFDVAKMSVQELQPFLDLAAATQTELTFATDLITESMKAFGLETADAARLADVFTKAANTSALSAIDLGEAMKFVAPIAGAAGVSIENTTAALASLAEKGIKGGIAGTALRRIFAELIKPGDKFADTLARLGLEVEDISLETNSFSDVLRILKFAGFEAGDAMEVFGQRAGPSIIALTDISKEGTEAIDTMEVFAQSLENAGGTAQEIAEELGNHRMLNMVMLGALLEVKPILPVEAVKKALNDHIAERHKHTVPKNYEAMEKGAEFARNLVVDKV